MSLDERLQPYNNVKAFKKYNNIFMKNIEKSRNIRYFGIRCFDVGSFVTATASRMPTGGDKLYIHASKSQTVLILAPGIVSFRKDDSLQT